MNLNNSIAMSLGLLICMHAPACGDQQLEQNTIYRVQPRGLQLLAVPIDKLQDGMVYKYYQPQLGKHVWGIFDKGHGFRYAMGPGSRQPTDRFDLQMSAEQKLSILKTEMPGLSESLLRTGRDVFLRLDEQDQWQLLPSSSIPRIYDQLSNRRWEWHGNRRVAVMHTAGYLWRWQGDRYHAVGPRAPGSSQCW